MGGKDDALTLQGLAQRLEALERENERMHSENAELRDEVAALSGSKSSQAVEPAFEGPVSRRVLLSKAGAAAVAAVAAGMLLSPREAKATHYADAISVDAVNTHHVDARAEFGGTAVFARTVSNNSPALEALNNGLQPAVRVSNDGTGNGVRALSKGGEGVYSLGVIGVLGESFTTGRAAVYGKRFDGVDPDSNGPGVVGEGLGSNYAGVFGRNPTGTGVWGQSFETGYSGVYGQHSGSLGYGIVGDGKGEAGAGVLGRNNEGTGVHGQSSKTGYAGVTAEHTGSAGFGVIGLGKGTTGAGVLGRNSSGYGGQFEGEKAQLKLKPTGSAGKPTGAHSKGEIYMDSAGTLFICVASSTSTAAAKWRKVTTTAV
jgi:hypothetical protein